MDPVTIILSTSTLFFESILSLTVNENIALPLQQTTKMSKREIDGKVMEKIDQLGLSEISHKYSSELSG